MGDGDDRVLDSKFKDKALVKTDDGEVEIVFSSSILIDAEVKRLPLHDQPGQESSER